MTAKKWRAPANTLRWEFFDEGVIVFDPRQAQTHYLNELASWVLQLFIGEALTGLDVLERTNLHHGGEVLLKQDLEALISNFEGLGLIDPDVCNETR